MEYGIAFTDVGKELVSKAFTAAGALHQAGDVHYVDRCGDGALGVTDIGEHVETAVGDVGASKVGFDGAKGEIGGLCPAGTYAIEKSGLTYVGEPNYTAFQRHVGYCV